MSEQPFKIGDVVQTKSGGPPVTVEGILEGRVCCAWWVEERKDFQQRYFNPESLTMAEGQSGIQTGRLNRL